MSNLKLANNAISRLVAGISTAATSLSVTPGDGVKFPTITGSEFFPATLIRASDAAVEIVKVTARSTDAFTIVRAQEGTAALTMAASDRIELRLTAGTFTDEVTRLDTSINSVSTTASAAAAAAQSTASAALPKTGGNLTGTVNTSASINEAKAANVASSATPDIWAGDGNTLHITGTVTITGFAAAPQAGARRRLIFDAATPITAGANVVIGGIASGATYTTVAGDIIDVLADTTTLFRLSITKISALSFPVPIKKRQSTQFGPMSTPSAGQPAQPDLIPQSQINNLLAAGVTLKCGTTPTLFSVANGFNVDGSDNNLNWLATADIQVAGLPASTLNIPIWVDTVAHTAGFYAVADSDQCGGTIPVTANKLTFDYGAFVNYLGNGTTAAQSNKLVVAEVDTDGTKVIAIRVRPYQGKAILPWVSVGANGTYTFVHGLGSSAFRHELWYRYAAYSTVVKAPITQRYFDAGSGTNYGADIAFRDVRSAVIVTALFSPGPFNWPATSGDSGGPRNTGDYQVIVERDY